MSKNGHFHFSHLPIVNRLVILPKSSHFHFKKLVILSKNSHFHFKKLVILLTSSHFHFKKSKIIHKLFIFIEVHAVSISRMCSKKSTGQFQNRYLTRFVGTTWFSDFLSDLPNPRNRNSVNFYKNR